MINCYRTVIAHGCLDFKCKIIKFLNLLAQNNAVFKQSIINRVYFGIIAVIRFGAYPKTVTAVNMPFIALVGIFGQIHVNYILFIFKKYVMFPVYAEPYYMWSYINGCKKLNSSV